MRINSGAINNAAINGGGNLPDTYKISANIEQTVIAIHTITANIEQSVFVLHQVSLDFQQTVIFREIHTVSANIGQTVTSTNAVVATISQAVTDPGASGAIVWRAVVNLDGSQVSDLVGEVIIEFAEGESRIASFSAVPASGSLDLTTWLGAPVTIDYLDDKGNYKRRFTGVVDEPVYDITTNVATFNCTNNRSSLLNEKTREQLKNAIGGYWSEYVFDPKSSNAEYADDRISTVEATYDADELNIFRKVPFAAKSTADYTFTESDILNESLSFQLASRDQLVNSITINFDYRYPRLRHRERDYEWDFVAAAPSGYDAHRTWADYVRTPTSLCPRAAIETAVSQTSWLLKSTPAYEDLPPAKYYDGVGWTPRSTVIKYKRDADGDLILDANGQPMVESRTVTDVSKVYAQSASWSMAKRFAQTLTESYSVTIQATQSVNQYGTVQRAESRGIEARYDVDQWEEYSVYTAPTGTLSNNGDYIIDITSGVEGSRSDFNNAWNTSEAIARREIKEAHRSNYVDFSVLLDPRLDLRHTVRVNTTPVVAQGKIARIIERMSIDEGSAISDVRIAVSKSTGVAPSDSGIAPPAVVDMSDATFVPTTIRLFNHFGNHYDSETLDGTENGFICNYRTPDFQSSQVEFYPTMFVVDGQQVSEAERAEREISSTQTKEIAIPNETLNVTVP